MAFSLCEDRTTSLKSAGPSLRGTTAADVGNQLLMTSHSFQDFNCFLTVVNSFQDLLLSAVCNCRLTVGTSNPGDHPQTSTGSDFGDPLEIMKNPLKFQPLPVPSKTRKSEPRVTKSLPKWSPKPPPGHLNLKLSANCKSNKNHCIYYVLGTSRHRIPVPCPVPNH